MSDVTKTKELIFVGPTSQKYTKTDSTGTATLTVQETAEASGSDPGLASTVQEDSAVFLNNTQTNQSKGYSAFFAHNCGGTSGTSSLPLTAVPGRLHVLFNTSHISTGTSTYRWSTDPVTNGPTNSFAVQNDNTSSVFDEYPGVALWFQKTGGNFSIANSTAVYGARTDWGSLGGITYDETTRTLKLSRPGVYCVSLQSDPTNLGNNSYTRADIRLVNPSDPDEVYASVLSTSTTLAPQLSCTGHILVVSDTKAIDVLAKFTGFSGTSAIGFSILINKIHSI